MIKSVLKEYNEKYNISYEKGFLGDLKTLKNTLKNPNLMLSNKLINNIDNLCKHYNLPLQVGVIGQFSSGKSSLLNLLFKKDILATGARPVSVVATYINYGLNDLILAEFENGLSELTNNIVNDQNEELNGLKSINVFTNNELLKDITLIDTPGLNANATDEEFSKNLFNSFDALIWLSLAESAGKASEEKAIKELKPNIKKICLINQKDKLNEAEQLRLKNYLNEVFAKYFEKIELISCKQASENNPDSNISAFYDFLKNLNKISIKEDNIKASLKALNNELLGIISEIKLSLDELEYKIKDYLEILVKNDFDYSGFNDEILNALKSIARTIANEFMTNFKVKNAYFYTQNDGIFHKNCFNKNEYSYKTLNPDDTFLSIFYNKDTINKQFLKIRKEINEQFLNLLDNFHKPLKEFKNALNIAKTKELDKNYNDLVNADFYAIVDDFYKALDELIINDYEKALNNYELKLNKLFEKINIKALNNYENAAKLSLSFFYEKINASREFYELDSKQFKLYLPNENEIYQRLLTDCSFFEFEELLINKKEIIKLKNEYLNELNTILLKHTKSLDNRQIKLNNIKDIISNSFLTFSI